MIQAKDKNPFLLRQEVESPGIMSAVYIILLLFKLQIISSSTINDVSDTFRDK